MTENFSLKALVALVFYYKIKTYLPFRCPKTKCDVDETKVLLREELFISLHNVTNQG